MTHLSLSLFVFCTPLPIGTSSVSGASVVNRRAYGLGHGKRKIDKKTRMP